MEDFIGTLGNKISEIVPLDRIKDEVDKTGLGSVVSNFSLPPEITNIFKGTPLEKYLDFKNVNLFKPSSLIHTVISAANNDLNGIKDWFEKTFKLPKMGSIDFSGYIILLMEICGVGVGAYLIYKLMIKKKVV